MLILVMGAPGTCKTPIRQYLCHERGFQDNTPEIDFKVPFPFFYDSVAAYVKALATEKDICLSRTFWEHKEIYIPANIKAGVISVNYTENMCMDLAYKRFVSFPGPTGIIYLKTEYLNASNRMQMNGYYISQECYQDYIDNYQIMFSKLSGVPFHELEVEDEDSSDLFEELEFAVNSFKRESGVGTIWERQMFHEGTELL